MTHKHQRTMEPVISPDIPLMRISC